eukprot:GFUD01027449.1.p1 GENE.GFUD01027449.1~~GFUD01027449.1.p1  ORF type:complete len:347 (-),score=78.14 GFUD01027449.1:67-1065(-)
MDPLLVDSLKKCAGNNIQLNTDDNINRVSPESVSVIKARCSKTVSIPQEIGVYVGSSTTDWFKCHFNSIYDKTCEDSFLKADYRYPSAMVAIFNKSNTDQKIAISNHEANKYEISICDTAFQFIRFFLQTVSEDSIQKCIPKIKLGFFGLIGGLEQCFRHRPLLEQVSNSYQWPSAFEEYLKENVPQIELLKGIPLDNYEAYTSPWANTIEDEEYVQNTYDKLEELIDDDPEVAKLITFLVLFSPQQVNLSPEESGELKQYQSKLTMILYNHLLSKPGCDNMTALEKLSKLGSIIQRLRISGEILKTKNISSLGLDFPSDAQDLDSIELCQL